MCIKPSCALNNTELCFKTSLHKSSKIYILIDSFNIPKYL